MRGAGRAAFLLESVEGGEKIGRYTFLGVRPFLRLESHGDQITIHRDSAISRQKRTAKAATGSGRIPRIETRTATSRPHPAPRANGAALVSLPIMGSVEKRLARG